MCFGYGFWACDEPETTRNIYCPLFDSTTYAPVLYQSCESSSYLCEFCSFNHPSRAAPPGLHLRTNPTRMNATNATTAESRWQKEEDRPPVEITREDWQFRKRFAPVYSASSMGCDMLDNARHSGVKGQEEGKGGKGKG